MKMNFSAQLTLLQLLWLVLFNNDSVHGVATPATAPFWQQCIDEHNRYRTEHKVPALKWSEELKKESEIWAQYLATSGLLSRGSMGESLYLTSGTQLPHCSSIAKAFYDEINKYNYNKPGLLKDTERFTQLIWKNTEEMGLAYAKRKDGKYIVVFRYKSQGNYNTKTAFQQNVLRPPVKARGSRITAVQQITTTAVMAGLAIAMV